MEELKEEPEWNPGFYDEWGRFIPYEKAWYCNQNKTIHATEHDYKRCKYCNEKKD